MRLRYVGCRRRDGIRWSSRNMTGIDGTCDLGCSDGEYLSATRMPGSGFGRRTETDRIS